MGECDLGKVNPYRMSRADYANEEKLRPIREVRIWEFRGSTQADVYCQGVICS